MNRKSIQKITHSPNYSQDLFNSAKSIVQKCNILKGQTDSLPASNKAYVREKQLQLQSALKTLINTFGKFTNVQKSPLGTPLDHSLEIFEAVTDIIQTSVQKYKEASKNVKPAKVQTAVQKTQIKQFKRPQDKYPFIKHANFEFHSHEKCLQGIRTDQNVMKSRSIQQHVEYVETVHQLQKMVEQLSKETEVAVDVEHSNKSYEGMTCLLQFSSRQKDYIVDVFPLWKDVPLLKRIMENQNIIKVMHGAEMDTKWFQRDFNIHIINLFDTYRASRVLGFPKLSYAYLLNHYCNETTNKTYQLADWRIRPLTQEMLHYARIDTHYLLQIFDKLRADIHQKALTMGLDPEKVISDVYAASYEVTKNQVQLFDFRKKEFFQVLRKDIKQNDFKIFDKVFQLLNQVAKEQDISFDQLITHKVERQIIAKLRELLYHRGNDNVRIKIDRLIFSLKEMTNHQILQEHLAKIKFQLQDFFNKALKEAKQTQKNQPKIKKNNKVTHLEEFKNEENQNIEPISKSKYSIKFKEFSHKTYQGCNVNPFTMLTFEPIAVFLAKSSGVQQKQEEHSHEMEEEQSSAEVDDQQMDQMANQQQGNEKEEEGIIGFKRMNPNVIYTIEQAEIIEEKYKPRKKRRELEYEKKLKNKEGNIYQLLED